MYEHKHFHRDTQSAGGSEGERERETAMRPGELAAHT